MTDYLLTTNTKEEHDALVKLIEATDGLHVANPLTGSCSICAGGTEEAWEALRAAGALDGVEMQRNEPVAALEEKP